MRFLPLMMLLAGCGIAEGEAIGLVARPDAADLDFRDGAVFWSNDGYSIHLTSFGVEGCGTFEDALANRLDTTALADFGAVVIYPDGNDTSWELYASRDDNSQDNRAWGFVTGGGATHNLNQDWRSLRVGRAIEGTTTLFVDDENGDSSQAYSVEFSLPFCGLYVH